MSKKLIELTLKYKEHLREKIYPKPVIDELIECIKRGNLNRPKKSKFSSLDTLNKKDCIMLVTILVMEWENYYHLYDTYQIIEKFPEKSIDKINREIDDCLETYLETKVYMWKITRRPQLKLSHDDLRNIYKLFYKKGGKRRNNLEWNLTRILSLFENSLKNSLEDSGQEKVYKKEKVDENLFIFLECVAEFIGWITVKRTECEQKIPKGDLIIKNDNIKSFFGLWNSKESTSTRNPRTKICNIEVHLIGGKTRNLDNLTPLQNERKEWLHFLETRISFYGKQWKLPKEIVKYIFYLYDLDLLIKDLHWDIVAAKKTEWLNNKERKKIRKIFRYYFGLLDNLAIEMQKYSGDTFRIFRPEYLTNALGVNLNFQESNHPGIMNGIKLTLPSGFKMNIRKYCKENSYGVPSLNILHNELILTEDYCIY
jgi:hypothetical protein